MIENNKRHPDQPGMYNTKDTIGYESFQFWTGIYWSSTTGHPIEFWEETPQEPTDKQIEKILEQ